ncbi:MAG: glutathione S-transferase family protein [Pseudomonadota bacterium]
MTAKLTYFASRGRAETTRWMLAACGIPFENVGLSQPDQLEALRASGKLPFDQLPLLELDGARYSQTSAMIRILARRGDLYGDGDAERAQIDMIAGVAADFVEPAIGWSFQPSAEAARAGLDRTLGKFGPRFEALLSDGRQHIAAGRMSLADVVLAEATTHFRERDGAILDPFPLLAAHQARIYAHPGIAAYLASPLRWPLIDDDGVVMIARVLRRALPPHFPDPDRFVST